MGLTFESKISKVVNVIFAIVILVTASVAYSSISHPDNHVDNIVDNWKELNIYDIVTVNANESCPIGYSQINDVYKWPGTEQGCICGNEVRSSNCDGCDPIPSTPNFDMQVWRSHIICLFRAGTSVYYAVDDDDCSDTKDKDGETVRFIKCGSGDRSVCVEEKLGCPITQMSVVSVTQPRPAGLPYSVYLGDSYVLYYERGNPNSSSLPIVELHITEGLPCLETSNDDKSKEYYTLIKSKDNKCDKSDNLYTQIDSQNEFEYYSSNNYYNIMGLPRNTPDTSITWGLYYKRSVLWKEDCRDNRFSRQQVGFYDDPVTEIETLQIVLLVVDIILALWLMILDPILTSVFLRNTDKELTEYDSPLSTLFITDKVLKIIMLPFLIVTVLYCTRVYVWYRDVEDENCSDGFTNDHFDFAHDAIEDTFIYDWINFGCTLGMMMFEIIIGLGIFVARTKDNFGIGK